MSEDPDSKVGFLPPGRILGSDSSLELVLACIQHRAGPGDPRAFLTDDQTPPPDLPGEDDQDTDCINLEHFLEDCLPLEAGMLTEGCRAWATTPERKCVPINIYPWYLGIKALNQPWDCSKMVFIMKWSDL